MELAALVQFLNKVVSVSLHANDLGKDMTPSLLPANYE